MAATRKFNRRGRRGLKVPNRRGSGFMFATSGSVRSRWYCRGESGRRYYLVNEFCRNNYLSRNQLLAFLGKGDIIASKNNNVIFVAWYDPEDEPNR